MAPPRVATAAALYLLWYVQTRRHKNRLGAWGPHWARWAVQHLWFDVVMKLSGVSGHLRFTPSALDAQKACVVTVSPHGAFAVGFICLHSQRLVEDVQVRQFRAVPVGASVLFAVPLVRSLLAAHSSPSAHRRTRPENTLLSAHRCANCSC